MTNFLFIFKVIYSFLFINGYLRYFLESIKIIFVNYKFNSMMLASTDFDVCPAIFNFFLLFNLFFNFGIRTLWLRRCVCINLRNSLNLIDSCLHEVLAWLDPSDTCKVFDYLLVLLLSRRNYILLPLFMRSIDPANVPFLLYPNKARLLSHIMISGPNSIKNRFLLALWNLSLHKLNRWKGSLWRSLDWFRAQKLVV